MKLELNEHKKGVAEVAVEVSPEELRTYQEHAAVTVGKELEVEGFRKGKAPLDVVVRKVGDRTILAEAAQLAISDAFRQATKEHNLAPISDPEAVITKLAPGNPLEFKLRIPVMPEVSLSDYASIA
ncbi:MAG: trigger factor family protein, partial [Candidatus Pacearchaeota archaeon]|nr:trigger factor family protein [Candidatus Pacearchaeota archaeon]